MTNISKTIIFFGTEDFSLTTLTALIDAGYPVAAVVTKPDSKSGRGQKLTPPAVKSLALEHNIPVWQPLKVADINESVQELGDVAGVLVSYGKIIPQSTLDLFSPGIINVHPSLLPLYRGSSPIESVIRNGDSKTGVSIMRLVAAMDAGPVYTQVAHTLTGYETRPELYNDLARLGADTIVPILPSILDGSLSATDQDDEKATYTKLLSKQDSPLQPQQVSATEAERLVRAHLGFPKTKVTILGHDIIITKSHVSSESKTPLDVLCQDGAYLSIDELIAPSGRTMSAQAFMNGYAAG